MANHIRVGTRVTVLWLALDHGPMWQVAMDVAKFANSLVQLAI